MSAIPPQPPKVLAPLKVSRQFLDACEGEGFWAEDSNYAAALTFWLLECNSLRKYCLDLTAKMPPKGVSTRLNPVRLQTIPHLRVRRPNQHEQNPCVTIMSSMLSCWASSGGSVEGCAALEQQLRQCMDGPKPKGNKKNTINYHLMRMYPKVVGPKKKEGRLG
ncbi:40S ribosomal protein mrp10 [Aspergillus fumigatus]